MQNRSRILIVLLSVLAVATACSSDTITTEHTLVSAQDAHELTQDPPAGLVVLDIRTPEEFDEGHLEGAVMVDFYATDFGDQLDALDKDVPYLMYCRSGNRSAQAASMMEDLGFEVVYELDGGIVTWANAGYPIVRS